MDVKQEKVIECQPHEEHPAKDVTPYVYCLICPPEYARKEKEYLILCVYITQEYVTWVYGSYTLGTLLT
jgi:hypothetical protein